MENDLSLFMDKVLIDEEEDSITIIIEIKEMLEEASNVIVRFTCDNEIIKEEKFKKGGKENEN